jgi:hypothetical protein
MQETPNVGPTSSTQYGYAVYVRLVQGHAMTLLGLVVVNAVARHKMFVEHFMIEKFGPRVTYVGSHMSSIALQEMWYINHQRMAPSEFNGHRIYAMLEDSEVPEPLWGTGYHVL